MLSEDMWVELRWIYFLVGWAPGLHRTKKKPVSIRYRGIIVKLAPSQPLRLFRSVDETNSYSFPSCLASDSVDVKRTLGLVLPNQVRLFLIISHHIHCTALEEFPKERRDSGLKSRTELRAQRMAEKLGRRLGNSYFFRDLTLKSPHFPSTYNSVVDVEKSILVTYGAETFVESFAIPKYWAAFL